MAVKYDRIGDGYDLTRRADPRIADRLTSLLDAAPGASVLDVACGTGNYTFALAERGLGMVGGDLSQTMLAQARAKHPHLPLVRAEGAALPFADNAFAHAITTLAIHHMADLRPVLSSVRRVVAGGGRYVIWIADRENRVAFGRRNRPPSAIRAGAGRRGGGGRLRYQIQPVIESMIDDVFRSSRRFTPLNVQNPALPALLGVSANTVQGGASGRIPRSSAQESSASTPTGASRRSTG